MFRGLAKLPQSWGVTSFRFLHLPMAAEVGSHLLTIERAPWKIGVAGFALGDSWIAWVCEKKGTKQTTAAKITRKSHQNPQEAF